MRYQAEMKKNNGRVSRRRRFADYAATPMEQMELYCIGHPGSPSAMRRPRLFFRSELWIALLGPCIEEGIVGIGRTVAAALRAFDTQYLAGLRPPADVAGKRSASIKRCGGAALPDPNLVQNLTDRVSQLAWPS